MPFTARASHTPMAWSESSRLLFHLACDALRGVKGSDRGRSRRSRVSWAPEHQRTGVSSLERERGARTTFITT
jgi:hypothetical protein